MPYEFDLNRALEDGSNSATMFADQIARSIESAKDRKQRDKELAAEQAQRSSEQQANRDFTTQRDIANFAREKELLAARQQGDINIETQREKARQDLADKALKAVEQKKIDEDALFYKVKTTNKDGSRRSQSDIEDDIRAAAFKQAKSLKGQIDELHGRLAEVSTIKEPDPEAINSKAIKSIVADSAFMSSLKPDAQKWLLLASDDPKNKAAFSKAIDKMGEDQAALVRQQLAAKAESIYNAELQSSAFTASKQAKGLESNIANLSAIYKQHAGRLPFADLEEIEGGAKIKGAPEDAFASFINKVKSGSGITASEIPGPVALVTPKGSVFNPQPIQSQIAQQSGAQEISDVQNRIAELTATRDRIKQQLDGGIQNTSPAAIGAAAGSFPVSSNPIPLSNQDKLALIQQGQDAEREIANLQAHLQARDARMQAAANPTIAPVRDVHPEHGLDAALPQAFVDQVRQRTGIAQGSIYPTQQEKVAMDALLKQRGISEAQAREVLKRVQQHDPEAMKIYGDFLNEVRSMMGNQLFQSAPLQ